MKAIFINSTSVEALKAYGIELVDSQPKENILDKLPGMDVLRLQTQTRRLLNTIPFSNMGLTCLTDMEDRPYLVEDDDELFWDVFLEEGHVTRHETITRLKSLNCVTSIDNTLIFFEDDKVEGNLYSRILKSLSMRMSLDDVIRTDIWKLYLKNC